MRVWRAISVLVALTACAPVPETGPVPLSPAPPGPQRDRAAAIGALVAPLVGKRVAGIDVSHYQGQVDWGAVKAAGVNYAYAKAVQGDSGEDDDFQRNWQGMKAAGILRGAYDFYVTGDEPQAQAQNFINRVQLGKGDLPPMVDVETMSGGTVPDDDLIPDLHEFLETLTQHYGQRPIIYTSPGFWNANFDDSFRQYPLWVAEYGVSAPKPVKGWAQWTFWQYSQSGSVTGIGGAVDLDHFNGGAAKLLGLVLKSDVNGRVSKAAPGRI